MGAQSGGVLLQAEVFDILIRIIQHRMKMAAKICQIAVNRGQCLLQPSAYLPGGVGGSIGGFRFNQVDHRFCLRQRHLTVEEGSFGKLAPLGRLRACKIQGFQSGGKHRR